MKVYIVFQGSSYPYANGDIIGVCLNEKDAKDIELAAKSSEAFIEEHELIE